MDDDNDTSATDDDNDTSATDDDNETSATDDQSPVQLVVGISMATVGVVTMVIVGFAVIVVVIKKCKLQNEVVIKDIALPER